MNDFHPDGVIIQLVYNIDYQYHINLPVLIFEKLVIRVSRKIRLSIMFVGKPEARRTLLYLYGYLKKVIWVICRYYIF